MTPPLSLECGFSSDAPCIESWNDLIQSNDKVLVSPIHSLRLSLNSQNPSNRNASLFGLLFLPRVLCKQFLMQATSQGSSTASRHVFDQCRPPMRDSGHAISFLDYPEFTSTFMTSIHPSLSKEDIRAILFLQNEHHAPADVVLLNLSTVPPQRVQDLLEATNCRTIQDTSQGEFLLKILLVSEVSFVASSMDRKSLTRSKLSWDLPTCPLCIHRIEAGRLGLMKPRNAHLCSKFCPPPHDIPHGKCWDDGACAKQQLLRPWPSPSHCACCHTILAYWNQLTKVNASVNTVKNLHHASSELSDMFCFKCPMQETLWVCLTCGFVGCGRYSNKHAAEHFVETNHPFSLELATLRVWDYVDSEYVHRPDLLECPSSPPLLHALRSSAGWGQTVSPVVAVASPGDLGVASSFGATNYTHRGHYSESSLEEKTPKKASMLGEEYEALLYSALEEQAQHYEGEISRLQAALTAELVDVSRMTIQERQETEELQKDIESLRSKIDAMNRDVLDAQGQEAGHRAISQTLLREQQVAQDLLASIKGEAAKEQEDGRQQIEELEQQIADLAANQRMRQQFSQDEELLNAQLFGTQTMDTEARSSQKKLGKKSRRSLRK